MSMQQPVRKQLGARGESAVSLFFEDINWGPLSTGNHDVGTDLFVQIRDNELTDMRTMIAVQVKTGDSWFDEPDSMDGQLGWWYREENKKHAEYWTNHHIPHILVIQSEDRTLRFWNFLNTKTIQDTGLGMKVFIPENQDLVSGHIPKWIDAASEARKLVAFEGSHWDFSIDDLSPDDWARYAMLAPRLISPHVNKGFSRPISWVEALALCIEAEPNRWDHFAKRQDAVPSADEALQSDEWGWRFAGAVYKWLCEGELDPLHDLDMSGVSDPLRAAWAVCLAISLTDGDEIDLAQQSLEAEIHSDQLNIDQGWLSVQKARVLTEKGQRDEAEELLQLALLQLASVNHDVTVSAIRSAAISALYELSTSIPTDLSAILPAMDTMVGWWRSQMTASGLESAARRYFKTWGRDQSISFGTSDAAHNKLFSSALVARLAGSHSNWRATTTLMAIVDLSSERPQESRPLYSLDALRRAGSAELLGLAIKRIRDEGPCADLVDLVAGISAVAMTKTSIPADLVTLRHAGMYCTKEQSENLSELLLDALFDSAHFIVRNSRSAVRHVSILDALTGLAYQLPEGHEHRICDYVLSLNDSPDQQLESPLRRLTGALSRTSVASCADAIILRAQSLPEKNWYYWLLLSIAGSDQDQARVMIGEGLLEGNFKALYAMGTYVGMSVLEAEAILKPCAEGFNGYRTDSQKSMVTGFAYDFGKIYAATAVEFPEDVDWRPLLDFLSDKKIYQGRKRSACRHLAESAEKVPEPIRQELFQIADDLCADGSRPNPPSSTGFLDEIGGAFYGLYLELAVLNEISEKVTARLATILAGDDVARHDAASYLSRHDGNETILLAMTREENFEVGRWAMLSLARRICEAEDVDAVYHSTLLDLAREDGEANAQYILGGFAVRRPVPVHLNDFLEALVDHPSAYIRRSIEDLRG